MNFSSGTRIGRYELGALIGVGGMGEVYLAKDTELERTVTLKLLRTDAALIRTCFSGSFVRRKLLQRSIIRIF